MKRWLVSCVLALMITLLLCGCIIKRVNYNEAFAGGSGQWQAEFTARGTGEFYREGDTMAYRSNVQNVFMLKYTGNADDLKSVQNYLVEVQGTEFGMTQSEAGPIPAVYVSKSDGSNGAVEPEDSVIHVSVTVDGEKTSFDMKSK